MSEALASRQEGPLCTREELRHAADHDGQSQREACLHMPVVSQGQRRDEVDAGGWCHAMRASGDGEPHAEDLRRRQDGRREGESRAMGNVKATLALTAISVPLPVCASLSEGARQVHLFEALAMVERRIRAQTDTVGAPAHVAVLRAVGHATGCAGRMRSVS